jgi:hypothetical protein
MTNINWYCGECERLESVDSIQVVRISPRLYQIQKFRERLNLPLQDLEDLYEDDNQSQQIPVEIKVRCHHCGKPLCQRHRVLIADNVFGIDRDMARTFLPTWWPQDAGFKASERFRNIENQVLSLLIKYHPQANKIRQKAYHCQDCWQNHHPFTPPENE